MDSSVRAFAPRLCVVKCELLHDRLRGHMTNLGLVKSTDTLPAVRAHSTHFFF